MIKFLHAMVTNLTVRCHWRPFYIACFTVSDLIDIRKNRFYLFFLLFFFNINCMLNCRFIILLLRFRMVMSIFMAAFSTSAISFKILNGLFNRYQFFLKFYVIIILVSQEHTRVSKGSTNIKETYKEWQRDEQVMEKPKSAKVKNFWIHLLISI